MHVCTVYLLSCCVVFLTVSSVVVVSAVITIAEKNAATDALWRGKDLSGHELAARDGAWKQLLAAPEL